MNRLLSCGVLALALVLGCSSGEDGGTGGAECKTHFDCPGSDRCLAGVCVGRGDASGGGVGAGTDAGADAGLGDSGELAPQDTSPRPEIRGDAGVEDAGTEVADPGADEASDGAEGADSEVPTDDAADPGAEDATDTEEVTPPVPLPCASLAACETDELCNLTLGRCETRESWKATTPRILSFYPPAGDAGDSLVIDGERFYGSLLGHFSVSVTIGGASLGSFSGIQVDENRIVATIPATAGDGAIVVRAEGGATLISPTPFVRSAGGVLGCDGSTPAASGADGWEPLDSGPYAAGYLDISTLRARIYYPARCGSVRRPAQPGTWPLVMMLHGNGAVHLMFEYAAQLLATWGFVSVLPATESNNEYSAQVVEQIAGLAAQVRGLSLADLHPALTGVTTTDDMAWVAHSRGCARTQNTLDAHADLSAATVGAIFLGPHDEGSVVPGAFLVVGAGKDGQSFPAFTHDAYERQPPPRWKVWIPGANHGSFADHKVYYAFDGQPQITRHEQLGITASFVLPFMQRAFGLAEPFASQLDTPPESDLYEVTSEL